ncbi:MAG: hypothetical protein QXY21_01285 [Candidatus Micrarchaeaceae archaeon]
MVVRSIPSSEGKPTRFSGGRHITNKIKTKTPKGAGRPARWIEPVITRALFWG